MFNVKINDDKIIKSTENTIEISIDDIKTTTLDCYLSYEKREVETSHKYYDFIITDNRLLPQYNRWEMNCT